MTGQAISHYEILEQLGEGGMGVVYKARDVRLGRYVAAKILSSKRIADPERKRRFVQEAQAASALNHPNIVTIYEIDQTDDVHFIAMEYIHGQTLDQMIPRKGLKLGDTLKYAVQIAGALSAAHTAGIIHRDLKPGNIMVTGSGLVKLLDFGLAKLTEPERPAVDQFADTETIRIDTPPRTDEGTILGTVAYMSPEQVEGRPLDLRSDIFSFGALLYEMITGRRAFQGDSKISTMAAILTKTPKPPREIVADVPHELEKLIGRCLQKDPTRRFQLMEDLKLELEELKKDCDSGYFVAGATMRPTQHRWRSSPAPVSRTVAITLMAVLVLIAAVALARLWFRQSDTPVAPSFSQLRLTQLTRDPGLSASPALSPDGKLLAFTSDRAGADNMDIWVQQIDGGGSVRLTDHEAADHSPSFSSDGTKIVFRSERDGGGIYVIPALGGVPRLLVKGGNRPQFSPDGRHIVYTSGPPGSFLGSKLFVVTAEGGTPRQLQPAFHAAATPVWTPDGEHLIFVGTKGEEDTDVWVTSLKAEPARPTHARDILQRQGIGIGNLCAWAPQGDYVLFSGSLGDGQNLWRIPVSRKTWQATGQAERVTFGVMESGASVARDGRVAFVSGERRVGLWSLPLDANQATVRGPLQLLTDAGGYNSSSDVSANGRAVVFRSLRTPNSDIWIKDLDTGREAALTENPAWESIPKISRDGSRVAFQQFEQEKRAIYIVSTRGGVPEKVCEDCGPPSSWSADGKRLLYLSVTPPSAIHLLDLGTKQHRPFLRHPSLPLYCARFSADDRWITCKGDIDDSRTRIFVIRADANSPPAKEWIAVTEGRYWDDLPRWSPDGNLIYFVSDRDGFRCIWARRLDPRTKQPVGEPFPVHHLHQLQLSITTLRLSEFELGVARNRLVFPMAKLSGNIWLMEPQKSDKR